MKRILAGLLISIMAVAAARAQDSATQQQIDKLSGQIQDVLAAQAAQEKRISALERQINDLGSQLNQVGSSGFASQDDLQKLAQQVQEIDKKRQEDNDRILKELEKLDKSLSATASAHNTIPVPVTDHSTPVTNSANQKGYYCEVKNGYTLITIAKAYQKQGIKVTVDDILKANPGLDPKKLKIGQKIFIPAPSR